MTESSALLETYGAGGVAVLTVLALWRIERIAAAILTELKLARALIGLATAEE